MAKILPLVTALFTLLLAPVLVQGQVQGNVKNLGYANYRGVVQDNGISYWLGMRYAAAPLGNLRFAEPQDPPVQEGIVNATEVRLCLLPKPLLSPLTTLPSSAPFASLLACIPSHRRMARTV